MEALDSPLVSQVQVAYPKMNGVTLCSFVF